MKIVTGRIGRPHVSSGQMQVLNRSILGDFALLDIGTKFRVDILSQNIIRINDGAVVVQGVYAITPNDEYDDIYIPTVAVGHQRIDTIYLHYIKDSANDTETFEIDVEQGEEVIDYPVPPTITPGGDIWEGATDVRVPIYDVLVTSFGLTVTPYERMESTSVTVAELKQMIDDIDIPSDLVQRVVALENGKADKSDTYTKEEVDAKMSAIYTPAGDITCAGLNSTLLNADHLNFVYNTTDSGTTTSDFKEGAGVPIPRGSNVAVVNAGTHETPVYKFDLLSGFVDLTGYYTKTQTDDLLGDKVDKVTGKGLSTNDYTNEDKDNVDTIPDILEEIEGAKTVDGSVVTVSDAASINAESVIVDIEPYQEGSGDPSPSNVRPIHGWNECKITGAGKNLLDGSIWELGSIDSSGGGFPSTTAMRTKFASPIAVEPNTVYTFSEKETSSEIWLTEYSGDTITVPRRNLANNARTATFTTGADTTSIRFRVNLIVDSVLNTETQLELGTTATDYVPYLGTDYTIDFGDTIYGGTLDATKGELIVNKGIVTADDFTALNPTSYSGGGLHWTEVYVDTFNDAYALSSVLLHKDYANGAWNSSTECFATENGKIRVYTSQTSLANFKNIYSDLQIVYELATPYTIKLTPQQIKLLENTNTLYANCGDITLKYQPNNALGKVLEVAEIGYDAQIEYIKSNYIPISEIAPVENGATASTSYAVDDYLCRNNKLYKVISAIAQGATFTDNNIQKTTVMAEILSRL